MSKKIIVLIPVAIILTTGILVVAWLGCNSWSDDWSVKKNPSTAQDILSQSDDIDFNKLAITKVAFQLDQILEQAGSRPDLGMSEQRDFDIYLERPDLKLKQPRNINGDIYTSDLRPELRPVRLLVSEPDDRVRDSGNSCRIGGFPHGCTLNLSATEQGKPKTVLIKVVFADKFYAEKEITIPYAGVLKESVILEPKTMPKNGDTMRVKFQDIGATEYKIGIHTCRSYQDDGINPCLEGVEYSIKKVGNRFVWLNSQDSEDITIKDGTIDVIFPAEFNFDRTSVSVVYNITATLQGATDAGVKTFSSSDSSLELKR